MSEYYVDPKTGRKHKWVLATDNDFEKIEPAPQPAILPALYIPGITQEPITTYSSMTTPPDGDFSKVGSTYRYRGTAEYVEIPHRINGEILTSYAYMFEVNRNIKAVKSTNKNITNMTGIFYDSTTTRLDLSELDTTGVRFFGYMFTRVPATEITGLTNFDTSSGESFKGMFLGTNNINELDLSSFDMSNAVSTDVMFRDSSARTVYVKDSETKEILDNTSDKPWTLTVKLGGANYVVSEETKTEEEIIPYESIIKYDTRMPAGTKVVISEGKNGHIIKSYKLTTYGDGRVEKTLINESVIEAENEVIFVGTSTSVEENKNIISLTNSNSTEIYFMNVKDDRDYFVDKFRGDPLGISEQFGITLRERPNIPTAQMRYEADDIQGMPGDHAVEDNYENVEMTLAFNYISSKNARETYNAVSNYLATMKPGTRVRFSDDNDGTFRVLARRPSIEPLNNDLYNWGDFEIELTLKPFRYIEEEELSITTNASVSLKQPLPNAMNIPQRITHYTERNVNIETYKNGKKLYTINSSSSNKNRIITDAELLYTYGGD